MKIKGEEQKAVEEVSTELFSDEWWKEASKKLKAPFPEESYQDNSSRTGTPEVGIRPQYVIERLNDAFGANHWEVKEIERKVSSSEYSKTDKRTGVISTKKRVDVFVFLELLVGEYVSWIDKETGEPKSSWRTFAKRQGAGGMRVLDGNVADATKGAETDALKKAASKFDVAEEAYKGKISIGKARIGEAKYQAKQMGVGQKDVKKVLPQETQKAPTCPDCGEIMKWRVSQRGPFWGCSRYPSCSGTRSVDSVDSNGEVKPQEGSAEHQLDYTPSPRK